MSPALWGLVVVVVLGLFLAAYVYGYERGTEAGRHKQRRLISQVVDELRREGENVQAYIDYLYEQTRAQITRRTERP